MCFQILEVHTACRCLYYQHAVDRCVAYGNSGHDIQRRTILVGYACSEHNRSCSGYEYSMTSAESKRRDGHRLSTVRDSAERATVNPASASTRAATTTSSQETVRNSALSQTRFQEDDPIRPNPVARDLRPRNPGSSAILPIIAVSEEGALAADLGDGGEPDEPFDWDYESDGFVNWDDKNESDESFGWDEESVRSVASSATTMDNDIVGVLFNRLLNYGDLRFLWPQLIAQSSSWKRPQRTVERILHRYSQDLDRLTANPVSNESINNRQREMRQRASKFIRRSQSNLAQRICEAHYHIEPDESLSVEDEVATRLEKKTDAHNNRDSEDEDESTFLLEAVETFLFRTDPIVYMQANLKALVKIRIPQTETSLVTRVWNHTRLHFENISTSIERRAQPILPGSTRLRWACSCGKELHDDFVELRPGALADLDQLLQGYGKDLRFNNGISTQGILDTLDDENLPTQTSPPQQRDWKLTVSSAAKSCIGWFTSLARRSASLPRYRQDKKLDVSTTGACVQTGLGGAGFHDFLLLCIPFMRVATKLYQPEICRINSDQEFLKLLRHYYQTKRGRSPWRLLRKVKSIDFIKFEMYRNDLADIRACPSIPSPEKRGTEYGYDPDNQSQQDLDVMPPIGPNLLAHLFEHPEHADVLPAIWKRIPRKLKTELKACPTRGSSLGWGLHLVEGMEWFMFSVLGCAGFLVCLLVSVIWSVVKEDVQGGFSIGGFLLAFFLFCESMIHLMVLD